MGRGKQSRDKNQIVFGQAERSAGRRSRRCSRTLALFCSCGLQLPAGLWSALGQGCCSILNRRVARKMWQKKGERKVKRGKKGEKCAFICHTGEVSMQLRLDPVDPSALHVKRGRVLSPPWGVIGARPSPLMDGRGLLSSGLLEGPSVTHLSLCSVGK